MIQKDGGNIKRYIEAIIENELKNVEFQKLKLQHFIKSLKEINPISFLFTFCFKCPALDICKKCKCCLIYFTFYKYVFLEHRGYTCKFLFQSR